MSYDLQIVYPQAILPVKQVTAVPGLAPITLSISGGPFNDVEEVRINGVVSPSIVVVSTQQILAEVPASEQGDIQDVEVLSSTFFLSDQALYRFRLGTQTRLVTGLPKLIQTFLRMLLQTPGSSLLAPEVGGGLLALTRAPLRPLDEKSLRVSVYQGVQRTAEALLTYQSRLAGQPRTEQLADARLLSCGFPRGKLSMELALSNQAGQSGLSLFDLLPWRHEGLARILHAARGALVQRNGPLQGETDG